METRTEPLRTTSHHCSVNNVGKILVSFSLYALSLVKGTSQAGALTMCPDSALAKVLFNLLKTD